MISAVVTCKKNTISPGIWFKELPKVGHDLWITFKDGSRKSFQVVQISHWVGEAYSPSTHNGDPNHTAYILVKENK